MHALSSGILETTLLYLKDELGYNQEDNAGILVVAGFTSAITLALVFPPAAKRFPERNIIKFSLFVNGIDVVICFVLFYFVLFAENH